MTKKTVNIKSFGTVPECKYLRDTNSNFGVRVGEYT